MDFALETNADLAWSDIAEPKSAPRCCMHDRLPEKAVAFKGTNTGRRFYVCSHRNVSSASLLSFSLCGCLIVVLIVYKSQLYKDIYCEFVGWADPE
jgi:hypothetical protein